MHKIIMTGASGFVGNSLKKYYSSNYILNEFIRGNNFSIKDELVVLHFAGKAHDLIKCSTDDEYFKDNTELTKEVFNAFLASDAKVFITLSSVKAVADDMVDELTEDHLPKPRTAYGRSKLMAEQFIFSKDIPDDKRVYVLRPCMIHGPGNKGNLNLLYNVVSIGVPWPLGAFENKRSFCSIENLMFIIKELIEQDAIPSGIYNVSDDEQLSTNELIDLIAESQNRKPKYWRIPQSLIMGLSIIGDKLYLPLNTERLHKLTSSYVVSNAKIKSAIGKPLPVSCTEGLKKTFKSFNR